MRVIDESEGKPELEVIPGSPGSPGALRDNSAVEHVRAMLRDYDEKNKPAKKPVDITDMHNETVAQIRNTALWINGGDRLNLKGLEEFIDAKVEEIDTEIYRIQHIIDRHHQKTVKGHLYWAYRSPEKWIYKGKEDPRPPYMEQISQLEAKREEVIQKIRSCVIKEIGKHLVVDLGKFRQYVEKGPRKDLVEIREVVQ